MSIHTLTQIGAWGALGSRWRFWNDTISWLLLIFLPSHTWDRQGKNKCQIQNPYYTGNNWMSNFLFEEEEIMSIVISSVRRRAWEKPICRRWWEGGDTLSREFKVNNKTDWESDCFLSWPRASSSIQGQWYWVDETFPPCPTPLEDHWTEWLSQWGFSSQAGKLNFWKKEKREGKEEEIVIFLADNVSLGL